ncbi:MAG: phage portal protein [Leptolyngbyaceae cyanobacterium RM2_2_4]|nr:phage portal protein [Leptolyngbyaceae cyanobacterium RM2_2_4]
MSDSQDQNIKQPTPEAVAAADAISNSVKNKVAFALSEEAGEKLEKAGYTGAAGPLMYALEQATGSAGPKKAPALAFTENPAPSDNYLGLYKSKRLLLPDEVLKQIRVTDHLIAAILRARGSMMSLFGGLQKDRFDIGLNIKIKDDFQKILTPEQYEKVIARMKRFEQLLLNCGHTEGLEHQDRKTLSEFLDIQARNGLTFGRFATEVIYDRDGVPDAEGNYPFFRFRAVDVATIVRAVRKGEAIGNNLRVTALRALESLTGEKVNIDLNQLKEDKYAWLQVIDGTPRQAFTHDEMLVFDLFPSTDIEHNGYPVSPIDTVVSSITTHISIDAYKKLYFQNGRASKGMLVIQSDEVDQQTLDNMKLQFNASINSVSNSFRTPIFGIGKEDKVEWLSMIGEGARDADFQFMYDQVARNILSAFSISPDELPGYGHLSKGTNSQTLSECFDPATKVLTRDGLFSAEELLADNKEMKIQVWSGFKWENARIFNTGKKELRNTRLSSNLTLKTSPEHRFRVANAAGELIWKHQKDLNIGDAVLVNAIPVAGHIEAIPHYKGMLFNSDMMEVLGWMTGDGNVAMPRKRTGGKVTLFYHHDKETDVRERHVNILRNFNIDAFMVDTEISEEKLEKLRIVTDLNLFLLLEKP